MLTRWLLCKPRYLVVPRVEGLVQTMPLGESTRVWCTTGQVTGLRHGGLVESPGPPLRTPLLLSAEYAQTVGPARDYVSGGHGLQPGDPAKAAEAILAALDAEEPPLRLVLGGDAIDNIRARLKQLTDELDRWEQVGRQTAI
jgi:hypothetical protein